MNMMRIENDTTYPCIRPVPALLQALNLALFLPSCKARPGFVPLCSPLFLFSFILVQAVNVTSATRGGRAYAAVSSAAGAAAALPLAGALPFAGLAPLSAAPASAAASLTSSSPDTPVLRV